MKVIRVSMLALFGVFVSFLSLDVAKCFFFTIYLMSQLNTMWDLGSTYSSKISKHH
mgnify:CR=1 FL=1